MGLMGPVGLLVSRADRPAISLRLAQEGEKTISKAQEKQGLRWDPGLLAASSRDVRETPPPHLSFLSVELKCLMGASVPVGQRLLW